jgi:hypothetical protein
MASVTFVGDDLRTVYVGSLKGKRIPYFRSPVSGLPMVFTGRSEEPPLPTYRRFRARSRLDFKLARLIACC